MLNLRRLGALTSPFLLILITMPLLLITIPKSSAANGILLWLDTQTPTVAIGESFNVTVMISIPPSSPIAGLQFRVQWNSTIINGTSIMEALFHTVAPPSEWDNIWAIQLSMNKTGRYADYAYTFQDTDRAKEGGYTPISGTYAVAILTFKGADTGRCLLNFPPDSVRVGDVNAQPLPVTIQGLLVSVGNLPPIIEIVNPRDGGFSTIPVNLTFTANKPLSWIGYSVDDQANVTLAQALNGTLMSSLIQVSEGQHSLVMYANDSSGLMASSNMINFLADQTPPTISLNVFPSTSEAAAQLILGTYRWIFTFNASRSQGHLSNITYFWDFGDGTNNTNVAVTHEYRQPGTYNVTLRVTDLAGNTATQVKTITLNAVSEPLNVPVGLVVAIVIPAIWIPALAFYAVRIRKKTKKA